MGPLRLVWSITWSLWSLGDIKPSVVPSRGALSSEERGQTRDDLTSVSHVSCSRIFHESRLNKFGLSVSGAPRTPTSSRSLPSDSDDFGRQSCRSTVGETIVGSLSTSSGYLVHPPPPFDTLKRRTRGKGFRSKEQNPRSSNISFLPPLGVVGNGVKDGPRPPVRGSYRSETELMVQRPKPPEVDSEDGDSFTLTPSGESPRLWGGKELPENLIVPPLYSTEAEGRNLKLRLLTPEKGLGTPNPGSF